MDLGTTQRHLVAFLVALELTISRSTLMCESGCECFGQTMVCTNGVIPGSVPLHLSEVTLEDVNLAHLETQETKQLIKNWSHVTKLFVSVGDGSSVSTDMFGPLTRLEYLAIRGENITTLTSLRGLQNLKTLDLSSCTRLHPNEIGSAFLQLDGSLPVLPYLEGLLLSDLYTNALNPALITDDFYTSIAKGRAIKRFDVSGINIERFRFSDFHELSQNGLEALIAQRNVFSMEINDLLFKPFDKVKYLDLGGSFLLTTRFETFAAEFLGTILCLFFGFFPNLETLIIDDFKLINDIPTRNVGTFDSELTVDLSKCPLRVVHFSFANNRLEIMNVYLKLHDITRESVKVVDASRNGLKFISRNVFASKTSITSMNLSHNALTNVPYTIFINNELTILDLSNNEISEFTFKGSYLSNLQFLGLASNRIIFLDPSIRQNLNSLYSKKSFLVDISGNPFQCTCKKENFDFLDWLKGYAIKAVSDKPYLCDLDGESKDIVTTGIEDTQEYCRAKIIKMTLLITMPIISILIIASFIVVWYIRKRIKLRNRKREIMRQIQNGEMPNKYLVFLCYCSEDDQFVIDSVLTNLKNTLRDITQREQLVCHGDCNFRPGFYIFDESIRLIQESSVVLAVISKTFCKKYWCDQELRQAFRLGKPIVLLMAERVDEEEMPEVVRQNFRQFVHVSWVGDFENGHLVPEWPVLCQSIIELAFQNNVVADE